MPLQPLGRSSIQANMMQTILNDPLAAQLCQDFVNLTCDDV